MLTIVPLTIERWPDLEALFGPQGACYGCWCTYFRLAPKDRSALNKDERRAFMRSRVEAGPPPGLLGYDEGRAVIWMQVGPRSDVPRWNTPRTVSRPLDEADAADESVWAVSCFFARAADRGKGFSHDMVQAAIGFARDNGARLLEACPMEQAKQASSASLFVGSARVFVKAGFERVAERKEGRPLMRLKLT